MMQPIDARDTQPCEQYRVYAITARSSLDIVLRSNQFNELGFVEADGLVAILGLRPAGTSECEFTPEKPTEQLTAQLTAFSDTITELHQTLDLLPFRFARATASSDIVSLLSEHRDTYIKNLNHISGCTEVNARWALNDAGIQLKGDGLNGGSQTGIDYLRAKHRAAALELESAKELASIAKSIALENGIKCVDSRSSLRRLRIGEQSSVLVFGLEALLHRTHAKQYLTLLSEARFRNCVPTLTSGPWPPYSFMQDVNLAITKAPFYAPATEKPVQKCAISPRAKAAS